MKAGADLVGGTDACIEHLPEEDEADAEEEPKNETENAISHGAGLYLRGRVRRMNEGRR